MIAISLDPSGLHRAVQRLADRFDELVREGLEATCESIAARAKTTSSFVDRTGALRNSIQSEGVTGGLGDAGGMVGIVSFAAVSERKLRKKRGNARRGMGGGFPYGLALELGTKTGIKARLFITQAIDAEDSTLIEGAVRAGFVAEGFEVL
ncbi:MAG TPA: HK97 gp10 family phage protein [Polyangiaceae bacterium]|nr:HK97 gp10 family phage protein [Polyangiaceae bacterium]